MHCNPANFPPNDEFGKNPLGDKFELIESFLVVVRQVFPARPKSIGAWARVKDNGHCSSVRPPEEALNCLVCCGIVRTVEAFR